MIIDDFYAIIKAIKLMGAVMLRCQKLAQDRYRHKRRVKGRCDALHDLITQPLVLISKREKDDLVDYVFDKLSGIDHD